VLLVASYMLSKENSVGDLKGPPEGCEETCMDSHVTT
jgi:hypothetical protein